VELGTYLLVKSSETLHDKWFGECLDQGKHRLSESVRIDWIGKPDNRPPRLIEGGSPDPRE
jgi:hypothetical protein